jgi:hypothetical protein
VRSSAKKIRVVTVTRVLCALALAVGAAHYFPRRRLSPTKPAPARPFQAKTSNHQATPFGHPYYRYSVIPGGAYTADELKTALARDPIVASHYADFRVSEAHVVTLKSDKVCYVSYRVANKLYWTKRPLTLRKGEKLLTDGVHFARTRCGNRLSDIAPAQTAAITEPDYRTFEAPTPVQMAWTPKVPETDISLDFPFQIASGALMGLPEPLANLARPMIPEPPADVQRDYVPTPHEHAKPPIFAIDGAFGSTLLPAFFPTETPPVSGVPEPGTAALGGLAFIGIALVGRRLRNRS